MKRIIKKAVKRVPGVTAARAHLDEVYRRLDHLQAQLTQVEQHMITRDRRLDTLRELLKEVEPYQPTYHVSGMIEQPMRDSLDRCRTIERYLGEVAGQHMLDIGASLGYICYYFADRGAVTEGWEYNPKNAEVARMVGQINGIATTIKTTPFDTDSIKTIQPGDFDVATILSVLHHTIYYNGLEYTQRLMQELVDKVPIIIVELAKKGEDAELFWNDSQPEHELDVFNLVHDRIEVKKIGEFGNHLSGNTRPLYAITRKNKTVMVNNKVYAYDSMSHGAYTGSPMPYTQHRRSYYFSPKHIVKEYVFQDVKDNNGIQIIPELSVLTSVRGIHNMPELMDFELSPKHARVVFKRIPGQLLLDMLEGGDKVDQDLVVQEILHTLIDLEKEGLHHNDIRSWNIIYDGKKASLIDYAFVSPKVIDNDAVALLWVIHAMITGERESYKVGGADLPSEKVFKPTAYHRLYLAIRQGESSPSKLKQTLQAAVATATTASKTRAKNKK